MTRAENVGTCMNRAEDVVTHLSLIESYFHESVDQYRTDFDNGLDCSREWCSNDNCAWVCAWNCNKKSGAACELKRGGHFRLEWKEEHCAERDGSQCSSVNCVMQY